MNIQVRYGFCIEKFRKIFHFTIAKYIHHIVSLIAIFHSVGKKSIYIFSFVDNVYSLITLKIVNDAMNKNQEKEENT